MRRALYLIFVLVLALPAVALDKEDILKLTKKPHSRKNLIPQLGIFGEGREYKITMTVTPTDKDTDPSVHDFVVTEKTVEGKYIVSDGKTPDGRIIMAVTFDAEEEVYLKYVLTPNGDVIKSTGFSVKNSRAIAWRTDYGNGRQVLALEQHGDKTSAWTERYLEDDKIVLVIDGEAHKTK